MKKSNFKNLLMTAFVIILTCGCLVFLMAEPTETTAWYWTLILMKFAGLLCGYFAFILAEKLSAVISPKESEEL